MAKEIQIPFNTWSRDRLRDKRKTATSRTQRYGDPGDTFTQDGVRYEITGVYRLPLGVIATEHFAEEGADSSVEFIKVWTEIHPRKPFNPTQVVDFHKFKEVKA